MTEIVELWPWSSVCSLGLDRRRAIGDVYLFMTSNSRLAAARTAQVDPFLRSFFCENLE